ncbi:MAG: apolipoprotein N-acyltransferase [Isosphaeraceae bacterium]
MSSVAAPDRETHADELAEPADRWMRHRLAAGVASGLILWTAFPPLEWAPLAWIALAPLFWLATIKRSPLKTYFSAWAGGLVFWILAVPWLRLIGPGAWIGWVVLGLVFSLWWPFFLLLTRWAYFRLRVPLILAAPIAWVAVEYIRAYFLTGFPWYYLAHTQYRYLYVIQIADLTGSLGVSLCIAVVNAWLVDLVTLPLFRTRASTPGRATLTTAQTVRLWAVTILVGSMLFYGGYRVSSAQFREGPKLALLQSNLVQAHKFQRDRNKVREDFETIIKRSLERDGRPDLIVWPETSYPFVFIKVDPSFPLSELEEQIRSAPSTMSVKEWLETRDAIVADLHGLTDRLGVPMLVGCALWDHQASGLKKYNSAVLFEPMAEAIRYYHKMHLVPFGEFIPLVKTIPWLALLTPYRDKIPSLNFGEDPVLLPIGRHRFAASICFEDTIPQVIGRFFQGRDRADQPDMLINLSNDGWYANSSELDTHLAIGVFRTVEHRVPLARAVNTGLSALVDGNGEIRAVLPKDVEDVLAVTVPLDDRTSYYSRWGDWLGLSCLAVTIGLFPMGLMRNRSVARSKN